MNTSLEPMLVVQGKKGVKITLQEVFTYESKAPSKLYRKLYWNSHLEEGIIY